MRRRIHPTFKARKIRILAFILPMIWLSLMTSTFSVCADATAVNIGVLLDDDTGRWQSDSRLIQERAHELGAKIIIKNAQSNDDVQLQQAKQLLDAGANVLIVVPHDSDKAASIVQAAHRKGVPVISYDRLVKNSPVSLYISFDNVQVGKLQASSLLAIAPRGSYFLVEGASSDNNAHQFERGHMVELNQAKDAGRINIVDEVWCQHWTAKESYDATVAALNKSNGKISAVVAANDDTAAGAIQALAGRKLAGTIPVSGQDANLAAIVRIIRGTQTMTIYKPLGPLAKRAVDAAVALAGGRQPETIDKITNGDYAVPAILLQPIAVTRDNLGATVISDGFHTSDEIKKSLAPGEWEKFISRKR